MNKKKTASDKPYKKTLSTSDISDIFTKKNVTTLCIFALILSAIVFIVHLPALYATANLFDDSQYLFNNHLIKSPGIASAITFLTEVIHPSTVKGYYQPLAMISLMCDYAMGANETNPFMFHFTSLMFHTLNTCLIMFLIFIVFKNPFVAIFTALIFGVHPMTVETVAWIGERKTTLAAFFSLLCLIFYVLYTKKNSSKLFLSCLAAYILALMSKPTSTMLPIAFLLLDFWPLNRITKINLRAFKIKIFEKLPLFLLGLISAVITYFSQKLSTSDTTPSEKYPMISALWRICHNIIFYPLKMLYPKDLTSHYPVPNPLSLENSTILYSVIGTFLFLTFLILSLKKTRAFFTGTAIFACLILPATGIIGFTIVIASDKYAYLPAVGFLLIIAYYMDRLWFKQYKPKKSAQIGLLLLVTAIFSCEAFATRQYLANWQDTETLYRHMIQYAPNADILYSDLGISLKNKGRFKEAIKCYEKAISLNPKSSDAYNNLGNALRGDNSMSEAIKAYQKSIELDPRNGDAYNDLAIALCESGRLNEGVEIYKKAIEISPNRSLFYRNYGVALIKLGQNDEASKVLYKALQLDPNNEQLKSMFKRS